MAPRLLLTSKLRVRTWFLLGFALYVQNGASLYVFVDKADNLAWIDLIYLYSSTFFTLCWLILTCHWCSTMVKHLTSRSLKLSDSWSVDTIGIHYCHGGTPGQRCPRD